MNWQMDALYPLVNPDHNLDLIMSHHFCDPVHGAMTVWVGLLPQEVVYMGKPTMLDVPVITVYCWETQQPEHDERPVMPLMSTETDEQIDQVLLFLGTPFLLGMFALNEMTKYINFRNNGMGGGMKMGERVR